MTEGTGAAAGDAGAAAGATPPWYEAFDAETKGYLQNRGLEKKTAAEAFLEASKFHREAEKFIGAPANEMLRLPKDANAPEWQGVRERLGKPKDAKDYDFAAVKHAGDKPLDAALSDVLRAAAFNVHASKEDAVRLATEVVKYLDGTSSAKAAIDADQLTQEKEKLKQNWGANYAANELVAKAAITKFGLDPVIVAQMETGKFTGIGYAKVMDFFRELGAKMGEDRFVNSQGGNNGGVMTRDQAAAEKAELMRDKAWAKRYLDGGTEERRKMDALNRIIVG